MTSHKQVMRRNSLLPWVGAAALGLILVPEARAQKGHGGGHSGGGHMSAPHVNMSMPRMNYSAPRPPKMPNMNHSSTSAKSTNRVAGSKTYSTRASKGTSSGTLTRTSGTTGGSNKTAAGIAGAARPGTGTTAATGTTGTPSGHGRARRYWGYAVGRRYGAYNSALALNHRYNQMVIARLRTAHANLARINHDYAGNRVRAMHNIGMAIRQLSHRSMMYQGVGYAPRVNNLAMQTGAGRRIGTGTGGMRMPQAMSDARMRHSLYLVQGAGQMLAQSGGGMNYNNGYNAGRARALGYVQMAAHHIHMGLMIR
jgi:hypothetical protein